MSLEKRFDAIERKLNTNRKLLYVLLIGIAAEIISEWILCLLT
jgi:hypothetical protein